jgi:hypothetical protein
VNFQFSIFNFSMFKFPKRLKRYRRIYKSLKKIGLFSFLLFFALNIGKIQGTNSFFMDTASVEGNTLSAGYWVPPTVSISSPAGGEEWQVGSSHNILWSAASSDPAATAGMDIDIDYSCGGDPWQTIIHNTTNDGTQSWTVPADISSSCKVKVTATDSHGLANFAESGTFEISYMVVLNEFVPYPPSGTRGDKEFVELYNYGMGDINVNGWRITDNHGPDTNKRMIDSAHTDTGSTVIGPGTSRFLVVKNYDSFYLNDTGSNEVRLYDADKKLIDSHGYSNPTQGKSYARVPDGVGTWVDPVPTPGKKNTDSNDIEDFQKYYRKVCFDKNGKPVCDLKFLRSIGLLDEESEAVKPAEAEETVENNPAENGESENPVDQGDNGQEEIALADEVAADPAAEDDEPAAEDEDEPKIITKEFNVKLSGKLDVPEGFEADISQKIKKIELSGEEKVINDLKDFEIDLAEIKIKKEESKIEILVSDLDLPKNVELVSVKKDDVIVLITVAEKPKEESKDDAKKDDKKDEVKPANDGVALKPDSSLAGADQEDKKDGGKDKKKDSGDGSGGDADLNNSSGASE